MTFTISIRELVASLLVLPPSVETSATFIFARYYRKQGFYETFVEILGMDIKGDVK
ncbi:hypothetical protein ACT4UT_15840 [Bacillus sp. B-TM1]